MGLEVGDLDPDPVAQFRRWFAQAQAAGQPEPEAMSLATATRAGVPSLRWVLLKEIEDDGFVFYTNEHSSKGEELRTNPVAALAFRWKMVDRQVRVSGPVELVGPAQSDAYFASRHRGSQLGAWASDQSAVIPGRDVLEQRLAEVQARFAGTSVPRPPWWGGYRVRPNTVELWQEGLNRLHDRFRYRRDPTSGAWIVERLSP